MDIILPANISFKYLTRFFFYFTLLCVTRRKLDYFACPSIHGIICTSALLAYGLLDFLFFCHGAIPFLLLRRAFSFFYCKRLFWYVVCVCCSWYMVISQNGYRLMFNHSVATRLGTGQNSFFLLNLNIFWIVILLILRICTSMVVCACVC